TVAARPAGASTGSASAGEFRVRRLSPFFSSDLPRARRLPLRGTARRPGEPPLIPSLDTGRPMLLSWFPGRIGRTPARGSRFGRRLVLDQLEDRCVPATVTWVAATSGNWDNPANWSDGAVSRVPGAGDDVVIPDLAGTQTILHDSGNAEMASLTSAERV